MYFKNRAEAGRMIADELLSYRTKNCAVVALTPGAVLVGAQIAMRLHADLMMLLTENIVLPGESLPLAGLTSNNTFTYNNKFSTGEIEEMRADYLSYIESQRIEKLHHLHMLLSSGGEIRRDLLRRRVVIIVSDGLSNGFSLDIAAEYLKPIKMDRLIVCTPIASIGAVDRMHIVADEMHCMSVTENYMDTDHYYSDNTIPSTENLIKIMRNTPVNWLIDGSTETPFPDLSTVAAE